MPLTFIKRHSFHSFGLPAYRCTKVTWMISFNLHIWLLICIIMNIVHHFLPSKYILTFVKKIKTCQLVIWPAWLQIPLRKWLSSGAQVKFWRPFCLCKLDGQELKIPLGNRVFRIQHTQIRLKSLVPNFYSKMPLELYRALFFRIDMSIVLHRD